MIADILIFCAGCLCGYSYPHIVKAVLAKGKEAVDKVAPPREPKE